MTSSTPSMPQMDSLNMVETTKPHDSFTLFKSIHSLKVLRTGEVVLVSMPADGPPEGWRSSLDNDQGFTSTTTFTQRDVNDGTVWYRHFGRGAHSDTFQFQVSADALFTPFVSRLLEPCVGLLSWSCFCCLPDHYCLLFYSMCDHSYPQP